jgi:hypothetical protein
MKKLFLTSVLVAAALTSTGARHRAAAPVPPPANIDIRRSLVITDPAVLDGFDFERVLRALTDRSGTSTTPLQLYRQWFDTQNPKPGLAVADAPHCDDFITNGKPSFNGFPRRCPTPEGQLATSDPFIAHDYIPIGITNRFDLTPADGSNCGQYRIVFAKITVKSGEKLHIIFEPVLPNPSPSAGAAACRPVAQFWADLSNVDSATERRARMEHFFFDGIEGFAPVLQPSNFASPGRIRTSQSVPISIGRFYQFHLQQQANRLLVVPGVLENLPYGPLYNAAADLPLGPEFRQFFISQVATLTIRDVNGFYDRIPEKYLIHESFPEDTPPAFAAEFSFNAGMSKPEGQAFKAAIQAELARLGTGVSLTELLIRADLQNCAGCHLGNVDIGQGLHFPSVLGGSHVDEHRDGPNFTISPALRDVFAPNRARILTDFLAGKLPPVHSNVTIGGGRLSE